MKSILLHEVHNLNTGKNWWRMLVTKTAASTKLTHEDFLLVRVIIFVTQMETHYRTVIYCGPNLFQIRLIWKFFYNEIHPLIKLIQGKIF